MKKIILIICLIITLLTSLGIYKRLSVKAAGSTTYMQIDTSRDPLQSPSLDPAFQFTGKKETYTITPLHHYEIHAKVIAKKNYSMDRSSDLSFTDLALIWGNLTEQINMDNIDYTQSGRWYHYRFADINTLTVTQNYIAKHSANTHIIAATDDITVGIKNIKEGDDIILVGYLVKITSDQFLWTSSTTRNDTGNGACEVLYVTSLYNKNKEFK